MSLSPAFLRIPWGGRLDLRRAGRGLAFRLAQTQPSGMTTLLAWRNLRHDPVRFGATLVGIVFSVTLMTIQTSLLIGFADTASGLVDHAGADLWIVSRGTTNVDQSVVLPQRDLYKALQVPGVADAVRAIVRYVDWRKPDGGTELVIMVGVTPNRSASTPPIEADLPWNLVQGTPPTLEEPGAVVIDTLYASKLGYTGLGQEIEIRGRKARIAGLTDGIRTFTQSPYVFTSYNNALRFTDVRDGDESYVLVGVAPDASIPAVAAELRRVVPDAEILTGAEFSARTRNYWIYATGAGLSLWLAVVLSAIVGITIVAQTLYAATLERLSEYATLSAMGAPGRYLNSIVIKQGLISGSVGCAGGLLITVVLFSLAQRGPVALHMSFGLAVAVTLFTLAMCVAASLLAVRTLMAIDPTSVFK